MKKRSFMPDSINDKSVSELISIVYDQNKMMVSLQNKINSLEKEMKSNGKKYATLLTKYYELVSFQNSESAKYSEFIAYLKSYFPDMFSESNPSNVEVNTDELSSMYISSDGNLMKTINNLHILDVAKYIIISLQNKTKNDVDGIE